MTSYIWESVSKDDTSIVNKWKEAMENYRKSQKELATVSEGVFENTNEGFIKHLINHVVTGADEPEDSFKGYLEEKVTEGWALGYFTQGLLTFRRIIIQDLKGKSTSEEIIDIYSEIDQWIDPLLNKLIKFSSQTWENTVTLQRNALMELSAPLIPVFEEISVLPLIGTIDTERAKLIMENLLNGVMSHRSEVVLIDITGVPVVDTMVAHHIIQAAEAVRLIGSRCILVGIRPEIAQTIVNLGIDLSDFPTKSTLKKGMETAFEITNKKIVSLS